MKFEILNTQSTESDDDWSLTTDQMVFMMQHHNAIEEAYQNDDMDYLRGIESSAEYRALFGGMSWDEAYDRYECMVEEDCGDS